MSKAKIVIEIDEKEINLDAYNGDNELDNLLVKLLSLRISNVISKTVKDIEEKTIKVVH